MANGDAECQRARLEDAPPRPGGIDTLLGGVDLDFVLETGDGPIPIDDQCGDEQGVINQTFGAENNRKPCLCGGCGNRGPGALEERGVRGRHRLSHSPVTGSETFRKTNKAGALH